MAATARARHRACHPTATASTYMHALCRTLSACLSSLLPQAHDHCPPAASASLIQSQCRCSRQDAWKRRLRTAQHDSTSARRWRHRWCHPANRGSNHQRYHKNLFFVERAPLYGVASCRVSSSLMLPQKPPHPIPAWHLPACLLDALLPRPQAPSCGCGPFHHGLSTYHHCQSSHRLQRLPMASEMQICSGRRTMGRRTGSPPRTFL